jgi:DNA-binding transcriptional MerR regulator
MARRLGVSPKALRIYERAGLVTPLRTGAGWRAYGPAEAARLHQVLALKSLGLPLRRIGELLESGLASLDAVLDLQERVLTARRADTELALGRLAAARAALRRSGALSLDELTRLTRDTVMNETMKMDDPAWGEAFAPLVDKHYDQDLKARLAGSWAKVEAAGWDQARVAQEWEALFAEARALQAADDTTSPRARDLGRRWMTMADLFTGGDPGIERKAAGVWVEAMADPTLGPRLPVGPDLFAFVGRIRAAAVATGDSSLAP